MTERMDLLNEIKEGCKHDQDKLDWTLMPWKGLEQVVKVLAFGARKYARGNWKIVNDARRRYLAAAYRHMNEASDGSWLDSESGLPHLAHAACCLIFLLWFGEE